MNMQDNEFDNLFRSQLDSFETEPSVNVWQNIDAGLHTGNRRRLLLPLLSAAASIIVLVTAGVLLIPHPVRNTVDYPGKSNIAKGDIRVKAPVTASAITEAQVTAINTGASPEKLAVAAQTAKKQAIAAHAVTTGTVAGRQPAAKQAEPEVIAAVQQKPDVVTQPKPDVVVLADNNVSAPDIKPIQSVVPDQITAETMPQPAKRHRIHSLGDMLNTVIAAVDKRKDKVLEFTDTDDDESVITGVNLGIVAVKKQN